LRKLYIIGPITSKAYKKFSRQLDELVADGPEPVEVELHSEGGSAYDGMAFFSKISTCPCQVLITAHGMVHSAAILVLVAGTFRQCGPYVDFMVHESEEKIEGRSSTLLKMARQAMREEIVCDTLMANRTGTPAGTWRQLHESESFLTASEALQLGLVHAIMKGNPPCTKFL